MIINLEAKLSGLEPVTREELIKLVNFWGRDLNCILYNQESIKVSKPKEKYDLSNLDA